MTTRRRPSGWTTAGVPLLMVALLALGPGVAEVWAKERAVRTPSDSAVKTRSSASSRTVGRSSPPSSGTSVKVRSSASARSVTGSSSRSSRTARNTRRIAPGSSRSYRSGRHGGHHHSYYGSYYRYYPSSYFNFLLGYGYWGYYPYFWGSYFYPRVNYGYGAPYYRSSHLGALDLNVKPKKAEVYLDGDYIGLAKDFDGYPGYLWLDRGTYEISFYMPGYLTLTREFRVYAGSVVDVRLRLEPGEAVLPEKPERSPAPRAERPPRRDEGRPSYPDDDRDRYRSRERWESEGEVRERDVRGEPGRLRLSITPSDATVYLDGRLLGSGQELSRLRAGLIVEPGRHLLEVVRPGFESKELEVRVEEGEDLELAVQLNRRPTSA